MLRYTCSYCDRQVEYLENALIDEDTMQYGEKFIYACECNAPLNEIEI